MNSKFSIKVLFLIAGFLAAGVFLLPKAGLLPTTQSAKAGSKIYFCPMHPTYTADHPGDCPICNMKLVAKENVAPVRHEKKERKILYYRHPMGEADTSPIPKKDAMGMDYLPVYEDDLAPEKSEVEGHASIMIPTDKQQMIGVKTEKIEKRKLVYEVRTVGRIGFDEELLQAQQDFISERENIIGMTQGEARFRARGNRELAKRRLRFLGMTDEEIEELKKNAIRYKNLVLPFRTSNEILSGPTTWGYGTLHEFDVRFIKKGTVISVYSPFAPGKELHGTVESLYPISESPTYTYRVRFRVENPDGMFKPETKVNLIIKPEMEEALAVPEEAVLFTGERSVVFVSDRGDHFEPRYVTLGMKAKNFYQVDAGLSEGDQVVTSGNFLIDSESRLQSALETMTGGHSHGA